MPGDRVAVYIVDIPRCPVIEGWATVVRRIAGGADLYEVRFEGERRTRRRFVHTAWQDAPEVMLQSLVQHYRITLDPALLDEFPR